MVGILVVLTIFVAVLIDVVIVALRRRSHRAGVPVVTRPILEPRPPHGVFVDSGHAWLRISGDGTLRVGIDEFLAGAVGEVERVALPARGTQVHRGEPLLRIGVGGRELVVAAPADGEVTGVNEQVSSKPWLMTRDPYGVGWALTMWTRDHAEAIKGLRIGAPVGGFLRQEVQRLADFLAAPTLQHGAVPVLADGGAPFEGSVSALDDAGWQAFQRDFLDREEACS